MAFQKIREQNTLSIKHNKAVVPHNIMNRDVMEQQQPVITEEAVATQTVI